jgi:hypothetical protein
MKIQFLLPVFYLLFALTSCTKAVDAIKDRMGKTPTDVYVDHLIAKGEHSSNQNGYKPISNSELNFTVKFDNSAVYQTASVANQGDINKLYGFADNNEAHHINSARIGWRWYDNQLQLFAYVYNNTVMQEKFISAVPIGEEVNCSIRVAGAAYNFTVNDTVITLPRAAITPQAEGYLLYPYFGGDETAPHDIHILIKQN